MGASKWYRRAMNEGYTGGGHTVGGIAGCVAGTIVALPLFGFIFVSLALGDCPVGADCWSGWVMLPTAGMIVVAVGFSVAATVNAAARILTNLRNRR